MLKSIQKRKNRVRAKRKARVRGKISGTSTLPRVSIFRSNKHVYAQAIDDVAGVTLASADGRAMGLKANREDAKKVANVLADALKAKKRSILSTRKKMAIMVKSGRSAESKLIKIDAKVNDLKMKILELQMQKNALASKIQTLTGIEVNSRVSITNKGKIREGEIFALKPLNAKLKASKLGVKAAKESYYPTIGLKGNYTYSSGDAINNDKDIDTDFADLGVFLNLPLYDASKGTKVEEAKLDYIQNRLKIEDTKKNLLIKAKELKKEISYLSSMLDLSRKNIKNQKRLLHIAKVSLLNGVFTEDEYLRYEDALAEAKASYSNQRAKIWQDKAQLAVIYGNDLKEIVQ